MVVWCVLSTRSLKHIHTKQVRFWDLRNPSQCLKILAKHTHWIWCARYNRYHDQLLMSSSSDCTITLWDIISMSSAPLGQLGEETAVATPEKDSSIKTYREHVESVYQTVWSANNAWVFASLSCDGKIVINHVPAATKYKILL